MELYRGPADPIPPADGSLDFRGENRTVDFPWDLAPLELPVGTQLTLHAEAADYRPGVGRTAGHRRITIISPDELGARIADRQSQIVRELERALAAQRSTRDDVRRLETKQHDVGAFTNGDRNTLQSVELNQRRVGQTLVDPTQGVPARIDALVSELEINRLPGSELRASMDRLMSELERLSSEPLSVAERELVAAHKTVDGIARDAGAAADVPLSMSPADAMRLARSLASAGAAQDEVITALERLIAEFSGRADHRRLAQQLAELRQEQLAHEQAARRDIGLETLPLQLNELSRAQRASLDQAATAQSAIADRFEKLTQAMDRLAEELRKDNSDAARRLADAATLARQLAIASAMQETASDYRANRVGQALPREAQIAADLERMLNTVREQGDQQPDIDLALEFVRRFQSELAKMVEVQRRIIRDTIAMDTQRPRDEPLTGAAIKIVDRLAAQERQLAQMAREHSELLFGLAAVRVSLEQAERRLAAAAELLDSQDTGPTTQQAELHALARLEGMLQAFEQTAQEASQNQTPPPGGEGAAGAQPPPRRPTFELLEVKTLRMLQVDLNERTQSHEARLSGLGRPPNDRERANLATEARELQAEQARLAELVQQMLSRDNEQVEE
jgi:hypothetical protein